MSRSVRRALAPCILIALVALVMSGCSAATKATQPQSLNSTESNEAAGQVGILMYAAGTPNAAPSSLVAGRASLFAGQPDTRPQVVAAETTITNGNVTWTLAVHWFDAADQVQAIYDPLTTVRMHTDSRGTGSVTTTNGSATLGAAGSFDTRGVEAAQTELTTNGTQADTLSYTLQGPSGSITVLGLCDGVLTNVVETKPVAAHYPSSGMGTWLIDVTRHFEAGAGSVVEHYTATVVVTFNGTHLVPLVVNNTYHYTLDLDTGHVTQAVS